MKLDLEAFKNNGWIVCDLPRPEIVYDTREALKKNLKKLMGKSIALEEYHLHFEDDAKHTELQCAMTEFYRTHCFGPRIMAEQRSLLFEILGRDINVQANPYLRMTRPGKKQDNIGYHRDTFYGGSPFELSVLIPFVDLPSECSLSVMSGSHIMPEKDFPVTHVESQDVTKGSAKHQLGFLYAPKLMEPSIEEKMEQIPLKVGQALFFHLSLVHGSVVNYGKITRWSSDIRIMNCFAPVDLSARPTYYTSLSQSIVTQSAQQYLKANEKNS